MAKRDLQKTSQTRVFLLEGGAGPATSAVYQGLGRALGQDWAGGSVTPIRLPSESRYGYFDDIDEIIGQRGRPTASLEYRQRRAVSDTLTLFQKGCPVDIHVHAGACTDPTDFLSYEVARILEDARPTNYSTGEQGAFDGDQEAIALETLPVTARIMYDVKYIRDSEIGEAELAQEVVGIAVADAISCGNCGAPSDGASVVFAVTLSAGGSPGLPAEVVFTINGGATTSGSIITTLGADEDPTDLAIVGPYVVVSSNDDEAIHYAEIADILAGTETWTRVATGIVTAKAPNRLFSLGRGNTWAVGDGGYIYWSDDITAGFEVQTDGSVTVQNLNDIHGLDEDNLIAVGAANAMLVTADGGVTWSAVTGPAPAVALTACWMLGPTVWLVGDANGQLWYTLDGGVNWTERTFSGSGSGTVAALVFATKNVGYMSHTTAATAGRVLRTIDGGRSWKALPEAAGVSITEADRFNRLAIAPSAPENIKANLLHAGGLAGDGVDGIWLKFA